MKKQAYLFMWKYEVPLSLGEIAICQAVVPVYLSTREVKSHLEKCGCLYYQPSVIGNTCK